jgi:hypothetical protein
MDRLKEMVQAALLWMVGVILGLAFAFGVVWVTWRFGMQRVPPNVARAWALIVTALLPVTAVLSWWFGNTEARGRLAGIDDAVDKVMGAALKTAKVSDRRSRSQAQPQPQPQYMPTQVEILEPRRRLSQDDVIEM